ncbi:unnamed protein product [Echinostoma caproni]|uniref:EF-hand domain-containing protein n=1 Tax=Echinostoma caproni TaxID=27848 RepID=A0A183AKH8_9TREM|nr:unnamed protein product [Echinostoma caproni]
MDTSDDSLELVFGALDTENKGYITVEQFVSTFREFYEGPNQQGRKVSTSRSTDDSGVHTHEPSIYDCDNDSALSVDGVQSSRLQRDDIRRSWPKHRGPSFLIADLPESPGSASRSDLLMDDMETNLELMRDQIQRMEERVEGIQNTHQSEKESRIDRLRDENARLTAQVTVLEERLKEAEARAQRSLEAERNHLQAIISRNSREHATEVEGLRTRISNLETECSDLRVESARVKADSQAAVLDLKRNTEALAEAQDQLRVMQQEKEVTEKKHQRDMDILRKDRDHAVQVVEMWTREKHANEQLRNYIDSLITRIIERHPSLLEVAATPAR